MRIVRLGFFVVVLALYLANAVFSQTFLSEALGRHSQAATAPQSAVGTHTLSNPLEAEGGLIKLDVLVSDKSGKPVAGLKSTDLTVLDNGRPTKLLSFQAHDSASAGNDSPYQVILVLDTLGMPAMLASHAWEEAQRFLQRDRGDLGQPVAIFKLVDSGLWLVAGPSRDGNALAGNIAHHTQLRLIRKALGPRGLFSGEANEPAGLLALKGLGDIATAERKKPGRKLLLWIGPHREENGVPADRERVFSMIIWFSTLLRDARVTLYNLSEGGNDRDLHATLSPGFLNGVKSAREAEFYDLDRNVLAVQSGGRALRAADDLASQIGNCIEEESVFYTVSFNPAPADHPNDYHDLKVQVGTPGSAARSNTGYYDQPYYQEHPGPSAKRVTAEQLGEDLKAIRGKSEREVVERLSTLELTERLNRAKLLSWAAELRHTKAKQSLIALADESAFLAPPQAEIPAQSPPGPAAQRNMISLADDYLNETIPKLPDFYATRTTVRYGETPPPGAGGSATYQPLRAVETSKATVLYSHGQEVINSAAPEQRKTRADQQNLTAYGTFGPILRAAIAALVASSDFSWSRWEQWTDGPAAVFRYVMPQEKSHFQVGFCCFPEGDGTSGFEQITGYHGEITIDPASGAMLRFTVLADLNPGLPLVRSDVVVDYGKVEIGGKTYICPVKSVAIWRSRTINLLTLTNWDESFRSYGPFATMLSDVTFDHYHLFRADSHVLTGSVAPKPQ